MSQKTIVLTVILFALIVVGMFMYAKLRKTEMAPSTQAFIDQPLAIFDQFSS